MMPRNVWRKRTWKMTQRYPMKERKNGLKARLRKKTQTRRRRRRIQATRDWEIKTTMR